MWNKPRGTLGEFRTDYVLNNEALKELSYIRTISNVYVENNGKQQHIDRIKGYTNGDICPYCMKPLRLIDGPYGRFYGCTGYPNCRFKRKA